MMNKALRHALEEAVLTQKEIARKLGVTESYISKIKRGQLPSEHLLRRLAKILIWDQSTSQALLGENAAHRHRQTLDRRRLKLATLADEPVILSADVEKMMEQVKEAQEEVRQMTQRLEAVNQSLQAIGWLLLEALTDRG